MDYDIETQFYQRDLGRYIEKNEDASEMDFLEHKIEETQAKLDKAEKQIETGEFENEVLKRAQEKSFSADDDGVKRRIEMKKSSLEGAVRAIKGRLKFYEIQKARFKEDNGNIQKTSTAEKIRILHSSGIVDHLKKNGVAGYGASIESISKILAKLIGANHNTIARSIRAIDNKEPNSSKNPTSNEAAMKKTKEFLESHNIKGQ